MKKILVGLALFSLLAAPIMVAAESMPGDETITECCRVKHNLDALPGDLTAPQAGKIVGALNIEVCDLTTDLTQVQKTSNWAAYCTIDTVHTVSDWIFWIVFVVAAIIIVYAGLNFMTATGDPEKAGKAKSILVYGVVGIIVAILAKFIPAVARYFVGV